MLPGPAVPGCCLISFHFRWGKLSTRTVLIWMPEFKQNFRQKTFERKDLGSSGTFYRNWESGKREGRGRKPILQIWALWLAATNWPRGETRENETASGEFEFEWGGGGMARKAHFFGGNCSKLAGCSFFSAEVGIGKKGYVSCLK